MTVSPGPLPLLPMWAMASSVVVGVGFSVGGRARRAGAGMYTYCIYLFLLLCCIISLGAQTGKYLMTHGDPDV